MIRSSGNRPYAPARRQPAVTVQAGGGPSSPAAPAPQPRSVTTSPLMAAFQQLWATLWSALGGLVAWLRGRRQAPASPTSIPATATPLPLGPQAPSAAVTPADRSGTPLPGTSLQDGQVRAGVGLTQVAGQPALGARVDARTGDTLVSGSAAVSRTAEGMAASVAAQVTTPNLTADGTVRVDEAGVSGQGRLAGKVGDAQLLGTVVANPQMAAGALVVTAPKVQGAIAGMKTKDSALVTGAVAARVGKDGAVHAEGLYQKGPEGVRANVQAAYQDPTTEAGLRYAQENEMRVAGGYLNKSLPHSKLSLGADYLWSPQGDGGRAYGRWQSDAIGETVARFKVKGALEAGAVKLPGQDWSTYAAGRVTAEKDNAALFAEVDHRAGPGFSRPDTTLKFGAQFRF